MTINENDIRSIPCNVSLAGTQQKHIVSLDYLSRDSARRQLPKDRAALLVVKTYNKMNDENATKKHRKDAGDDVGARHIGRSALLARFGQAAVQSARKRRSKGRMDML
jgi:hypothetical protein